MPRCEPLVRPHVRADHIRRAIDDIDRHGIALHRTTGGHTHRRLSAKGDTNAAALHRGAPGRTAEPQILDDEGFLAVFVTDVQANGAPGQRRINDLSYRAPRDVRSAVQGW